MLDLSHLNPEQREAVEATEGPVLVLAGAGSGKTRVLTHRIAHIIDQGLAKPGEILAITFTNRAAAEMRERLTDLLGYEPYSWVMTFHAACGRILRREADRIGLRSNFTIYDQDDATRLVRLVMKELGIDTEKTSPKHVQTEISAAKNRLQGPSALGHLMGDTLEGQMYARVYALYQERLHAHNAVDFDDMLMLAVAVLDKHEEARRHWQQRFKYVLVDEYQDTNIAQSQLLKILGAEHKNVFCVGDVNQCQPPETKVLTSTGEKPVAELDPDHDTLLSYDFASQRLVQAERFQVDKRPYRGQLIAVTAGGQTSRATPNHRWPVKDERPEGFRYVDGADLKPGDELLAMDVAVAWQRVERVEAVDYEGDVYSLDVQPQHDYVADSLVSGNSIYAFRMADIRNIIEFDRAFPDARVITLEQNYRSVNSILRVANNVILNNREQGPKTVSLWSELGEGEPIRVLRVSDEREEARYVVSDLQDFLNQGNNYSEAAVLYRTNAQSRAIEQAFQEHGIPYRIVGGPRFYDRAEIKDAMAYMKALDNLADQVSITRATQTPKRGLGLASLEKIGVLARQERVPFGVALARADEAGVSGKAKQAAERFYGMMARLAQEKQGSVARLLQQVLTDSGYVAALEAEGTHEARGRLENLEELIGVAAQFDAQSGSLSDFLQEVALWSEQDKLLDQENVVTLMTLHNAKGLEFGAVYLVGLEEGLLPHSLSIKEGDVEEERRLFYVGITRAKERLSVTYAAQRFLFGESRQCVPSRFLPEMQGLVSTPYSDYDIDDVLDPDEDLYRPSPAHRPRGGYGSRGSRGGGAHAAGSYQSQKPRVAEGVKQLVGISTGDTVRHPKFGEGVVTAVSQAEETVTVVFARGGERRLMLQYAPLEKVR